MRKHVQLRNVKQSERLYSRLVQLYPAPFREEFADSMKQVFRGQCLDAIERGSWRVIVFWCRTLFDFAWTCPKEHLVALPTLPARIRESVLRKPVWFHPTLVAVFVFGLSVFVTLKLPQFYASTATLEVSSPPYDVGPYFIETEFEKLQSKTVLYPVITNLALRAHYGELSPKVDKPLYELSTSEAYQSLRNNLRFSHIKDTDLIEVTVLDEDRSLATRIANEIAASFREWRIQDAAFMATGGRTVGVRPDEITVSSDDKISANQAAEAVAAASWRVKIINAAEDALRPLTPNRYRNIFLGAVLALAVGGMMMLGLWLLKLKRARNETLAPA